MTALLVSMTLILAHLASNQVTIKNKRILGLVRSLSGGISISYVFLFLLPELAAKPTLEDQGVFIYSLLGFGLFHAATKYIDQHYNGNQEKLMLRELHLLSNLIYNFALSFFIAQLLVTSPSEGFVLLVVVVLHIVMSDIIEHSNSRSQLSKNSILVITSVAIALGGLAAYTVPATSALTQTIFALISGVIIYISIREELPDGETGRPIFFVLGILITLSLTFIT